MTNEVTDLEVIEGNDNQDESIDYLQTWKITEFTETLNDTFKQKYDEDLNITVNTINNYFRQLEAEGIHYLNRINGVKIYDPMDLSIAEFISVKRSKKIQKGITWQLPQIFEAIELSKDILCRPKPENEDAGTKKPGVPDLAKELEELKKTIVETVKNEVENNFNIQQQLLEMKQGNERQVNRSMLEVMQKQNEFKALARAEWEKKSSSEKFEGLFFKREKIKEREQFIDDYVDKKLMEWMLEQTNG